MATNRDTVIFHIVEEDTWDNAEDAGVYAPKSFDLEGFIHCSTANQGVTVANNLFTKAQRLLLLCIDPDRVDSDIVYENLEGGDEQFPHIYGKLELSAVIRVVDLPYGRDGFSFPRDA